MLSFNELRYLAHNTKRAADEYTDASRPGGVNNPDFRMDAVEAARGRGSGERQQRAQAESDAAADAINSQNRMGYGKAMGMGAGAGALAGIPLALLAHALMADEKKKSLRDYLKSGLLGALVGGGAGALGGAGLRAAITSDPILAQHLGGRLDSAKERGLNPATMPFITGIPGNGTSLMDIIRQRNGTSETVNSPSNPANFNYTQDTYGNTGLDLVRDAFTQKAK